MVLVTEAVCWVSGGFFKYITDERQFRVVFIIIYYFNLGDLVLDISTVLDGERPV